MQAIWIKLDLGMWSGIFVISHRRAQGILRPIYTCILASLCLGREHRGGQSTGLGCSKCSDSKS